MMSPTNAYITTTAYITSIHIASRENCYLLPATEFNVAAS